MLNMSAKTLTKWEGCHLNNLVLSATGAHNTIVTSRAGKDLVSCLVSGLLTIGPRFGGAIDDAARCFQRACDEVQFCLRLSHQFLPYNAEAQRLSI